MKMLLRSLGLILLLGAVPLCAEVAPVVEPVLSAVEKKIEPNRLEALCTFCIEPLNTFYKNNDDKGFWAAHDQIMRKFCTPENDQLMAEKRFVDHLMIPINRIDYSIRYVYNLHGLFMDIDWAEVQKRYPDYVEAIAVIKWSLDIEDGLKKTLIKKITGPIRHLGAVLVMTAGAYMQTKYIKGSLRRGIYRSKLNHDACVDMRDLLDKDGLMKKPIAEQQASQN